MEYVVYLDVFLIINLFMDYLILRLTMSVIKIRASKIRIVAAAILGAMYSAAVIKPLVNHSFYLTLINILISLFMIYVAFGFKDLITYFKNFAFFMMVSFFMGGILNYLYYKTYIGKTINKLVFKYMDAGRFIIITVLAYIIIRISIFLIWDRKREFEKIYRVTLKSMDNKVEVMGLLDTGNFLREPVTGEIVHIAEYEVVRKIAGKNIGGVFVIPYTSVGEADGILYGLRIDEMAVTGNDKEIAVKNPIIGIYKGKLSDRREYGMLLNCDIFGK